MNASTRVGIRSLATGAVLAGALPWFVPAPALAEPEPPSAVNDTEVLRGEITQLTDQSLTLNDARVVLYGATTACSTDDRVALLADLRVGDRVKVVCYRDGQSDLPRALAIRIYR